MNEKKEDILEMIKHDIERRKKWRTEDDQWFYLIDNGTNDILYYVSGRFPEMKVRELTKIINEIKKETDSFKTIISEVYKNE